METQRRMLFLNVGWMIRYAGPTADDPTIGAFGYLASRTHGHECYNFTDQSGFHFGNHPSGSGTNLQRLGAEATSEHVDNIDVVWFSKHPNTSRAVIIGWYLNATVYKKFQVPHHNGAFSFEGELIGYKVKALTADCTLLPVNDRLFPIPGGAKHKGGYGQNVNWYGTDEFFLTTVSSYIDNWLLYRRAPAQPPKTRSTRSNDSERRRLVEQAAIAAAIGFYESPIGGARSVQSVEMQYKGWDLEAQGVNDTLLVEVKGLAGAAAVIELTPNEFAQMQNNKTRWVLFIVTNCLTFTQSATEVRYNLHTGEWLTSEGNAVLITQKTGAIIEAMLFT